jgi:hypothetical protein
VSDLPARIEIQFFGLAISNTATYHVPAFGAHLLIPSRESLWNIKF